MDLEAISSTYPQPTDFCFLLFCFLDENDGAECNERRRASQNRNAQRCFVHQATSFVFLPFGVEVCQSIHREAFCLILLFVFNPPYKSTPHSPRNNAISFKNKDRNGNWIFSLPYNAHTTHIVFLLKHSKLRLWLQATALFSKKAAISGSVSTLPSTNNTPSAGFCSSE